MALMLHGSGLPVLMPCALHPVTWRSLSPDYRLGHGLLWPVGQEHMYLKRRLEEALAESLPPAPPNFPELCGQTWAGLLENGPQGQAEALGGRHPARRTMRVTGEAGQAGLMRRAAWRAGRHASR